MLNQTGLHKPIEPDMFPKNKDNNFQITMGQHFFHTLNNDRKSYQKLRLVQGYWLYFQ